MTDVIRIRLFARIRELLGSPFVEVSVSSSSTVGELRRRLGESHPELVTMLSYSSFAVNNEFAAEDRVVTPADEIAVIPPVSGGNRDREQQP